MQPAVTRAGGTGRTSGLPESIEVEYERARPRSKAMFERAQRYLPGAETRAVTHFAPFPLTLESGSGPILRDVDGIEYIDVVNNYTSLVHGYDFRPVVEAQAATLASGTVFSSLHETQVDLAEALVERIETVDLVRFTNSGSEASALALRIARKATGRRRIVMARGGYHGGIGSFDVGDPETRRIDYNDPTDIDDAITTDTAAVFMEPFLGAGGVIPGTREFLSAVQARAREVGAVFVLDEVQSLRNGFAGMQEHLGLKPDITTLGKIIGGGLPIGAVGGRAELMQLTSPLVSSRLEHSGTFNGHISAAAGGLVALRHLDRSAIAALNSRAAALKEQIEVAASACAVPVTVTRAGSILNVHPGTEAVTDPADAGRFPLFRAALHLALLAEGVYTSTRGMINLSTALGEKDLDAVVRAYSASFERLSPYLDDLFDGRASR